MTTPTSYVLIDASGLAINSILLTPDHNWQVPEGCTVVPDPDGSLWAAATALPPVPPPTARERLEAAGFSVEELRELLLGGGSSL
jgi:hypothetical protein